MRGKVTYSFDGTPTYFIDGREVTQAEYDERFPSKLAFDGQAPDVYCWREPLVSLALGVHPEQVAEANERNRKCGIAARYDSTGKAHIPNRSDRNRLLARCGMHDNDAGYGDR